MVTVSGNPNPTYPTNPTNPTTKYRCEFGTLFCIYAGVRVRVRVRVMAVTERYARFSRLSNSQRYLANANPDSNPANPNDNSKR